MVNVSLPQDATIYIFLMNKPSLEARDFVPHLRTSLEWSWILALPHNRLSSQCSIQEDSWRDGYRPASLNGSHRGWNNPTSRPSQPHFSSSSDRPHGEGFV